MRGWLRPSTILVASVLFATALTSCSSSGSSKITLHVMAESSLFVAFQDIAKQFEIRNPDVTVSIKYGDSRTLSRRITQGASADVFASAGPKQMAAVVQAGDTSAAPLAFATNSLAVITPKDNPAHIANISDLARPSVKLALVSPGVPVGHDSRIVLSKARIGKRVNIVTKTQDAQGVVSQVRLDHVDAGICFVTDVTPKDSGDVFEIVIPARYNVIATYEVAPLSNTDMAKRFAGYVRSSGGRGILFSYGFGRPPA